MIDIYTNKPEEDTILSQGTYLGYEWFVCHNRRGYRNGYIRLPKDHETIPNIKCHGGLTLSKIDIDGHYIIGFDCAHSNDWPDPSLPGCTWNKHPEVFEKLFDFVDRLRGKSTDLPPGIRTQEYVEEQCKSICEQLHANR